MSDEVKRCRLIELRLFKTTHPDGSHDPTALLHGLIGQYEIAAEDIKNYYDWNMGIMSTPFMRERFAELNTILEADKKMIIEFDLGNEKKFSDLINSKIWWFFYACQVPFDMLGKFDLAYVTLHIGKKIYNFKLSADAMQAIA